MNYPDLCRYPYFGLDTETTGLNWPVDRMFGFSWATPDGQSDYYDIRKEPYALVWLKDQLIHSDGDIIFHNCSFDSKMFHSKSVQIPLERCHDTVIRAVLIDEHKHSYKLDDLVLEYLGEQKEDIWAELAALFGGLPTQNVQIGNLAKAPVELAARYGAKDPLLTLRLWEWQREEIRQQGIEDIVNYERGLMPTIIRAELRGIRVDTEYAERAMVAMNAPIEEAQTRLNGIAGWDVNVNSTPQMHKIFTPKWNSEGRVWEAIDGTALGTTDGGNASLKADYLREMTHPAAALVQQIRSLIKTRDTFLAQHVIGHAVDGRVYPNINQTKGEVAGTKWGRFSYTEPAMQQIPSRDKKIAEIVKQCFLPEEGHIWVDGDMHSFEVRVFAHLAKSAPVIAEYARNPGLDLHQYVADQTGLPRDAEFPGQPYAKQLNLASIFNQGNGATAQKMGLPWVWDSFKDEKGHTVRYRKAGTEAMQIINDYHERIPGIKDLIKGCKETAEGRGYIFTFLGRRIRFPNPRFSYKASGLLIQATSADLNKENWQYIEEELDDQGHLILNTHDSYGMSLPMNNWQTPFARVKHRIERPERLRVPLILELSGAGENWWKAIEKPEP